MPQRGLGHVPQRDEPISEPGFLLFSEEAAKKLDMVEGPYFKTILKAWIIKQSS